MRIIFFLFIQFILLLAELAAGTAGVYLPLYWMGFFYFACAQYSAKLILPAGFAACFIIDLILFHRTLMPDLFMFLLLLYVRQRYSEILRRSEWYGGLFGICAIFAGYFLQFAAFFTGRDFSFTALINTAALMITAAPFGYLIQTMLIYLLDNMQKKMKFESSFVIQNKDNQSSIYRRSRRFADD